MPTTLHIRAVSADDFNSWLPLWNGYNAFYGREGATALPATITEATWSRFLSPAEPMFALLAIKGSAVVGITHYLFHRSTTRIAPVCYLQDLYTDPMHRGQGVARALIEAVYRSAAKDGASRVYWQTHSSNEAGRQLYDKMAKHYGFIVYSHELPNF
jgi:GNAT superfamily N-acetyltransferase